MVESNSEKAKEEPMCPFFKLVTANDISEAETMLSIGTATAAHTDSTGMTALMHAAYKGHVDMCGMLLRQGCDVNADGHAHSYMPLHFAALSGSIATTQLLLDAGARTYKINSVGRTAAQMAGFVGNTQCVAVINNHVSPSELGRFTAPSGLHQTTTLSAEAAKPLHRLIMLVNLHPVHLAVSVCRERVELLAHLGEAKTVLYKLSKEETARSSGVNEVLAIKFHYLGYLLEQLETEYNCYLEKQLAIGDNTDVTLPLNAFLKRLVKRSAKGDTPNTDNFVRAAIRGFHCMEMPLFLQLVRGLSTPDVRPLDALRSVVTGQRGFGPEGAVCVVCEAEGAGMRRCARCGKVDYCGRECQKLHWSYHKKFCVEVKKAPKVDNKENNESLAKVQAKTETLSLN